MSEFMGSTTCLSTALFDDSCVIARWTSVGYVFVPLLRGVYGIHRDLIQAATCSCTLVLRSLRLVPWTIEYTPKTAAAARKQRETNLALPPTESNTPGSARIAASTVMATADQKRTLARRRDNT